MASADVPSDAPSPRDCTIVKWPDFDGYGFNLHADKNKPGQYIGKVDEGSPAEAAGLRTGDRIVEVNGVNIANENHQQVVTRIKAVRGETKLLVLDQEADKWYRDRKLVVKGSQSNVRRLVAPPVRPRSQDLDEDEEEEEEEEPEPEPIVQQPQQQQQPEAEVEDGDSFKSFEQDTSKTASVNNSKSSTPSSEKRSIKDLSITETETERRDSLKEEDSVHSEEADKQEDSVHSKEADKQAVEIETEIIEIANSQPIPPNEVDFSTSNGSAPQTAPENVVVPSSGSQPPVNNSSDQLNLNMSVQEMRALLASRKRHDPKNDAIDLRQKYAIIQDM